MVKDAKELQILPCPICRKRFKQRRWWQKQCSVRCTDKAYKLRQIERLKEEIREEMRGSAQRS